MKTVFIISIVIFSIAALSHTKRISNISIKHDLPGEISFEFGNADSLIKVENSDAKNISATHVIGVSDGKDFDTDSFELELPVTLQKSSTDTIDLETTYYFTRNRQVILKFYEWNVKDSLKPNPFFSSLSAGEQRIRMKGIKTHFKNKFLALEQYINSIIGAPYKRNLESEKKKRTDETVRDDAYWQNKEIRIHLYRFSDSKGRYNQIRALVYRT